MLCRMTDSLLYYGCRAALSSTKINSQLGYAVHVHQYFSEKWETSNEIETFFICFEHSRAFMFSKLFAKPMFA